MSWTRSTCASISWRRFVSRPRFVASSAAWLPSTWACDPTCQWWAAPPTPPRRLLPAALEGVAFAVRQGLEALLATGVRTTDLRLAGGGSLDPRWRQLLADVLERPLLGTPVGDASALGAALLAGVGFGAWRDAQRV